MRRTTSLRALAAGAGAAAVLLAAAPAHADTYPPFNHDWAAQIEAGGEYTNVSCEVSTMPGNERSSSIILAQEAWEQRLAEGNEYIFVVLKVANDKFDDMPFHGYGPENPYQARSEGNVTHALICQGAEAGDEPTEEPTDEPTEEPTEEPTATEEPTEEPTATDEPTDDPTGTDDPSGPPVETDGPSSQSGPNVGLLGGAALVLAGAGVAGYAMRRRDGGAQH